MPSHGMTIRPWPKNEKIWEFPIIQNVQAGATGERAEEQSEQGEV